MAETYADSSFLVSLFRLDDRSAAARRHMMRHPQSLPFNPLHRLEVRNAFRLGLKRREWSAAECKTAFAQLDADLQEGFLDHAPVEWTGALRRAEALSAAHTASLGNRAADILHVAIAQESGARTFLSFDNNQRALARVEGLTVKP